MPSSRKSSVVSRSGEGFAAAEVRVAPTVPAPGIRGRRDSGATVAGRRPARAGRTLAALAIVAALGACDADLQGNGVYLEEPRTVGAFDALRVEDGIAAYVTVGPAQTVKVIGDSNAVQYIDTSVDPFAVGSATSVLHVSSSRALSPIVPPMVVVTVPSLRWAGGQQGSPLQLKRPAGSTAVAPPLAVVLDAASLDATAFPTAGALVALTAGSTARLHSDGPVTGSVTGGSHLDNLLGTGPCDVTTTAGSTVACP